MAIVEIVGDDGSVPICIEVGEITDTDVQDFYKDRATRGIVTKQLTTISRQLYSEAIGLACNCAVQTRQRIDALAEAERPDQFEVTFALNVDMEVGAKIVNLDAGAQVKVRMQWNR